MGRPRLSHNDLALAVEERGPESGWVMSSVACRPASIHYPRLQRIQQTRNLHYYTTKSEGFRVRGNLHSLPQGIGVDTELLFLFGHRIALGHVGSPP